MKLVAAKSGICGFEFIQRAQFFEFFDRGGATAYYARHIVLSENFFCFAVKIYTFQLTAQMGFLKEGGNLKSGRIILGRLRM